MAKLSMLAEVPKHTREAVAFYWRTRSSQVEKQRKAGGADQGLRSAVTGGAHMDGFIALLTKLVIEAGIDAANIYCRESLELPGYFRPTKRWDFLVVVNGQLLVALETKSQVGPSFGNNFNNRTEEAMGIPAAAPLIPPAYPGGSNQFSHSELLATTFTFSALAFRAERLPRDRGL